MGKGSDVDLVLQVYKVHGESDGELTFDDRLGLSAVYTLKQYLKCHFPLVTTDVTCNTGHPGMLKWEVTLGCLALRDAGA